MYLRFFFFSLYGTVRSNQLHDKDVKMSRSYIHLQTLHFTLQASCLFLTSEYFPLYFPRLLSTLSIRCNNCSLDRDSTLPGCSSASLSMSEGGSYAGALGDSFSPKGVRDSRDEVRTRLSLDGERNRFSARLAPLRINDSIEGTFSCSFWANDCGSSFCYKPKQKIKISNSLMNAQKHCNITLKRLKRWLGNTLT